VVNQAVLHPVAERDGQDTRRSARWFGLFSLAQAPRIEAETEVVNVTGQDPTQCTYGDRRLTGP
jgi:hypothetical protein